MIRHLTGVILAGGRSRRFGSDKVLARHRGETFLDRSLRLMSSVFRNVVLVVNHPEKFLGIPVTVLTDEIPFQGPAGGIVTALRSIKNDGLFVIACDMPLLSPETILHLLKKDDGSPLVLYRYQDGIEPLCAVYRLPLLPVLESRLRAGRRDLHSLVQETRLLKIQEIPFTGVSDSFRNVNTPQDLKTLSTRLKSPK